MSLAEVKLLKQDPITLFNVDEAIRRWETKLPSLISHHGRRCCALAREWIFSTDHAQLNGQSPMTGPRWLRQRFTWGPSPWPIAWCEIVNRKVLDCGVFAALACEIFAKRGIRTFRTQVVQEFSEQATRQWTSKWTAEEIAVDWITAGLIYHEVCAVETAPYTIKLWDPSAGWWMESQRVRGYGSLRALRVFVESPDALMHQLSFNGHTMIPNKWHALKVPKSPVRSVSNSPRPPRPSIESENIPVLGEASSSNAWSID